MVLWAVFFQDFALVFYPLLGPRERLGEHGSAKKAMQRLHLFFESRWSSLSVSVAGIHLSLQEYISISIFEGRIAYNILLRSKGITL